MQLLRCGLSILTLRREAQTMRQSIAKVSVLISHERKLGVIVRGIGNVANEGANVWFHCNAPCAALVQASYDGCRVDKVAIVKVVIVVHKIAEIRE